MNNEKIRNLFPMLKNNIVYLDSGALVQKPQQVINAINDFYTKFSISNRTSDSELGIVVSQRIDQTRELSAKLLNCSSEEIIFNSGTTEGLNYASLLLSELIGKNDQILVSKYNHSSHIIPWIEMAKTKKAKIVFSDNLLNDINKNTKIICYTQINNNFNNSIDPKKLFEKAKKFNSIIVNDAAQAISHEEVNSKYSDIIAFSSNKLFGPTGLGILFVSNKILSQVNSKKFGGGATDFINDKGEWKAKDFISKHEPGTLNLSGIFGFYEALKFYDLLDKKWAKDYLKYISNYAFDMLSKIDNIKVVSNRGDSIILLEVKNSTSQDLASYLGHKNIYVRSGTFCAKYLDNILESSLVRISLHIYNNKSDIDKICHAIKNGGDYLDFL